MASAKNTFDLKVPRFVWFSTGFSCDAVPIVIVVLGQFPVRNTHAGVFTEPPNLLPSVIFDLRTNDQNIFAYEPRLLYFITGTSGGGGGGSDSIIRDTMTDLLERLPENFEMITMQLRAKPLLEGEAGPFVVVALQVTVLLMEVRSTSPVRSRR